jgi:predicted  nucleic acid-binding Zn-ribbon protein
MSEDILERAKKALIDDDMTYEDYDECISLLIAEVERLRSDQDAIMAAWDKDAVEHDARIKALEAEAQEYHDKKEEALTLCAGQNRYIERLEAAFLGATKEIVYAIHEGRDAPEGEDVYAEKEAREALEEIKNGND